MNEKAKQGNEMALTFPELFKIGERSEKTRPAFSAKALARVRSQDLLTII